jgi:class 3 adenylate cyclase/tetratricopeptide (TPR) repeat protein
MVKKATQVTPNALLRRARLERGWTQKDVADRIGSPLNVNVNRWERGTAQPSASYVQKLCALFGKSSFELGLLPADPQIQETTTSSKPGLESSATRSPAGRAQNLPEGTVTLLFMDMVESTRLLQQLGDLYANVLADYRRLVRTACGQWHGHEVDTQGDAFFVVFARAIDAAEAAVALQRALASQSWPEHVTVRARMALHTGEPHLSAEGYIGLDVHHAARIMSAGHPGQILLSQTTRDLVEQVLPEEMSLRDLGEHRLKDLRQPSHLFQLSSADLPADFPPLKTLDMHPWNVPFRRNPFFTGRTSLLACLHERLKQVQSQALALSGLGGIGKTQTAVEYAYRYRDEYSAVLWVRAASRETLITDFVALARLLELPGQDAQDQMLVVAAVKRWLEQHAGWLLILDNADDLPLLTNFLPPESQGHVLLTTRTQATGKIARSLPVEKMEVSEGLLLLLRRAKLLAPDAPLDTVTRALQTHAQAIFEELDGLPLALDQAGAYIEETGCSLVEYLTLYQQRRSAMLNRQSSLAADYQYTVASTWSLSFHQIEQERSDAAELLRLCAFLEADAIPEEILTGGATVFGPILGPIAADPFLLNEAIQMLRRYSLVKRDPEAKLLNIHRLVQAVLKDSMSEKEQRQWAECVVRAVNAVFPAVSFDTWSRCERCLSQALASATLIEQFGFRFPEAARLLERAGYYVGNRGLYGQGESLLQRALTIYEQTIGPQHPDLARTLHILAILYNHQGKYEQATSLLQQALAIREQALGAEHPDTASTLNELAAPYMKQGKYEQAESLLQRARAIREHTLNSEHPDVAESLNDLALLLVYQGKYTQAEPLYLRALAIRERILEPDHPNLAEVPNNLAWLYNYQGKYEQAELLYLRALAIQEQVLEPTHPYLAVGLNNLAEVYRNQGKYEQAESLCQRALAIQEQVLEPNDPFIAASLNTLAELYRNQGKYEQAEPLYLRSLAIREQVLGPTHARVAQSLANLAHLRSDQGQDEQAKSLYQRALHIREQALGHEHPDTASVREDYVKLLQTVQKHPPAT